VAVRRLAAAISVAASVAAGCASAALASASDSGRAASGATGPGSGGAGLGGSAGTTTGSTTGTTPSGRISPPPNRHTRGRWRRGFTITEYWPAPESWFVGKLVKAPGIPGLHHIDWLYSAEGLSMEGDGIGLNGKPYHISRLGTGGWVTESGAATSSSDGWAAGSPYWRAGGFWRNHHGGVTFPLAAGGWSNGTGHRYVPLRNVSFAAGVSQPLHYYRSIAVDPSVIPLGSRVYIPAYRRDGNGGWFVASDTGGAITGDRIDVYRPPPSSPSGTGRYLSSVRVFVERRHG
jgi:3D (Asp-Asp-Asp) domain-containing protein